MAERPLYRTIAEVLASRVETGIYGPGEPLPPEPLLQREFEVSRMTIRLALNQLKKRGLLFSRSGKGTLVRSGALGARSMKVTGSISELTYYAAETGYLPVGRHKIASAEEVAVGLSIEPGRQVVQFLGIRTNDEAQPIAYEEVYVPYELAGEIDNRELRGGTIFASIERTNGLSITEVRQTISAVIPPADVLRRLDGPDCCLKSTRIYLERGGRPVELAITFYNPGRFKYTTVLFAD
ncbi:GntR family transcriptional regulator [Mesorhizobium sp.]|uniref:GntR family transcriptional regulator n=1 Tax=Mesorhizobium sp. TaxID=1871066 RepID=UPI000FE60D52|nr:GntR family transcriptional regulator [Mesorhizobium sp.]RWI88881.1 MAG: GntR family transcriptional regulator [Mesorhizobium sp.]